MLIRIFTLNLMLNWIGNTGAEVVVSYGSTCGVIAYQESKECEKSLELPKGKEKKSQTRIVGGCPSPLIPWFAQILMSEDTLNTKRCGGVYINKFWILTAGHCSCNSKFKCIRDAKLGRMVPTYDLGLIRVLRPQSQEDTIQSFTTARDFRVVETIVHPKFEETEGVRTHDFALWRLDYPIADNAYGIGLSATYNPGVVMPICLPSNPEFQDIEKSVTVVGAGLERSNCFTTSQGPEAFVQCAQSWKLPGSEDIVKLNPTKDITNKEQCTKTELQPISYNTICKNFRDQLDNMGKKPASQQTPEEQELKSTLGDNPEEVVLVAQDELTNKTSGFKKVHCFLTGMLAGGWCGVCKNTSKPGEPGYCKDGVAEPLEDQGWGFCPPVCGTRKEAAVKLSMAYLYTLNLTICKELLTLNATEQNEAAYINTDVELCAGHLSTVNSSVVSYTLKDNKYVFKLEKIDHEELRSSRTNKSRFKYNNMLLGGVDSCKGDSGGPLWVTESVYLNGKKENRAYLVGIVSRGRDCANKDLPGIYGRVKTVLDWIKETASAPQNYTKKEDFGVNDISLKLGETRLITPFWEEPPDRSGNIKKKRSKKKKKKKSKKKKKKKKKSKKKKKPKKHHNSA